MQTFTFEISNNPKEHSELQTITSSEQDRGSMWKSKKKII